MSVLASMKRCGRSTTNTIALTPKRRAFHTEEVGFCSVDVPPLGGSSRDGEALCKGSDGVAAFDISHSLLGRSKCFATLSCQFVAW